MDDRIVDWLREEGVALLGARARALDKIVSAIEREAVERQVVTEHVAQRQAAGAS